MTREDSDMKEGHYSELCPSRLSVLRSASFVPAQVQVAQGVVHSQAFSQPLHPGVGQAHLPQVELQQAAVHRQHLGEVDGQFVLIRSD